MRVFTIFAGLAVLSMADAFAVRRDHPRESLLHAGRNHTRERDPRHHPRSILQPRDEDPANFEWVKKWAAIGDSFTAGIGSGAPLGQEYHDMELRRRRVKRQSGDNSGEDWRCSRYDRSYPMVLNRAFGASVDDFQFAACSGDRTGGIYEQANAIDSDLDLVVLTAGGNDLCLADLIKACIFLPGSEGCDNVLEKAQENIDNILKDNIRDVLDALKNKVKENGIVVYSGYAQFFDVTNEACRDDQDWVLFSASGSTAEISIDRRKQYNTLVRNINGAIKSVVEEYRSDSDVKYKIVFSNWDPWPYKGVKGQFCDPSSSGQYPDPDQEDLQFFKPDTRKSEELRRRQYEPRRRGGLTWKGLYGSVLYHSPSPAAAALHRLDKRVPSPPGCPSDGTVIPVPVSDEMGKNFHPNELGHITVASFASAAIMDARAEVLGLDPPSCEIQDQFRCWSDDGWKAYTAADLLDGHIDEFCNNIRVKKVGDAWIGSNTYYKGTPEEFDVAAEFRSKPASSEMDQVVEDCKEALDRIIHGCDGNDENPLNWKQGGQWRRGDATWEISPVNSNRPWPPPDDFVGECEGWWKVFFSEYKIKGGGWSTHDHGQKTLFKSASDCIDSDPTKWKFEYYDEPTEEGYEWKASFNTPVFVKARCFANNIVSFGAGGFTDGCSGNDA